MTLPNFLLIGVPRSGTTSLAHYLRQHPDVYMAPRKESTYWVFDGRPPRFTGPGDEIFARHIISDRREYEALFDGVRHERAIGESSVYYFHQPSALARIEEELPDVKVVVVLRDPIERAYSAFTLLQRDGREVVDSFERALELEEERLRSGWEWAWGYRSASMYAAATADVVRRFGERALFVRQDDLERDAHGVTSTIFEFLGVDPAFRPDVTARLNPGGQARSAGVQRMVTGGGLAQRMAAAVVPARLKGRVWHLVVHNNTRSVPISDADRAVLAGAFEADLADTAAILGADLSDWARVPDPRTSEARGG